MKGHSVYVLRSDVLGDCTNGGVTSPEQSHGKLFVLFSEEFKHGLYHLADCQDSEKIICLRLVKRNLSGRPYYHAEPMWKPEGALMAGGNFVFSSDSCFRRVLDYPVAVHDRVEQFY